MALTASCPSCGAPVVFRSASSVFAVCDYCRSTLVRHDQALEDIGKMAALAEDRSPLKLGAEGRYRGVHFALVGRIQLRYAQGVWNEWHLLFDDMRTGWLSEAAGQYALTFIEHVDEPLPTLDSFSVAQRLTLASRTWTVANIDRAECIAGEGELPFKVGAGYPVATVDLKNDRNFATLDYSETPPLLFVGEALEFASLAMTNLREGFAETVRRVEARVFRCPACGSPMSARSAEILAVGCASCGAVVDAADASCRILTAAIGLQKELYEPCLPLGSLGTLDGRPVEVIGFLVRRARVDGIAYDWREYLLAAENGTYRWLIEYDGHWNVADIMATQPVGARIVEIDDIRHGGRRFKHFSTTPAAEVVQVTGEFTWRVCRDETCRVVDYVSPPLMLSCESTASEQNWTAATYLPREAVGQAFGLAGKLPRSAGVFANQPNPWDERRRRSLSLEWKLMLAAIVLQIFFLSTARERLLLSQDFTFAPQQAEVTSREFAFAGGTKKLIVRNHTSLENHWMGLDLMLVNKATGEAWPTSRELSFYHGYDDGYWSEGSQRDEVAFRDIPAGTYYLTLEPEIAPEKPIPVRDRLEVATAGAGWSNFVLAMLFIIAFPLFAHYRHAAFETRRWAESDHPPARGED